MSVFGLTLIPYFTAYNIHYFYNSKPRGDRKKKRTSDSESASKNTLVKQIKSLERYYTQASATNKISIKMRSYTKCVYYSKINWRKMYRESNLVMLIG